MADSRLLMAEGDRIGDLARDDAIGAVDSAVLIAWGDIGLVEDGQRARRIAPPAPALRRAR